MERQAIAIFKANHPGLHTLVADAENSLATSLDIQGKTAAAESTYLTVLDMRRKLLGASHPDYLFTLFNYSAFLSDQGRCDESVKYSREVLALRGKGIPESHPSIPASLQTLGRCLDKLGETDEGGRALQESLDLRRKYLGADSWLVANSQGVLGEHYTLTKNFPRAEQLLLSADKTLSRTLGSDSPRVATNIKRIIALYDAWGKQSDAGRWKLKLPK
jgi:tetratricopeptide (TPR) repeat protein